MNVEHWDNDLEARVHEAAALLYQALITNADLRHDRDLWLREYETWKDRPTVTTDHNSDS